MRIGLGVLVAVLLAVPRIGAAQALATYGQPPAPLPRIYMDVNLLGYVEPLGRSRYFEGYGLKFGEVATFKATYPEPSRSSLFPAYVGGGFMLNRTVGLGVSYSRMSRETTADLFAQVPNPAFFNAMTAGSGTTGTTLSLKESAIHISLAVAPVRSNRMEFRIMGGPSFFTLKGDMVREIEYEQTFNTLSPQSAITINGFSSGEASGSSVGYHVGMDFTYFVHRFIGVTGGARYGRGVVDVTEPLSTIDQDLRVGSTTVFLGLRFRLGRTPLDK